MNSFQSVIIDCNSLNWGRAISHYPEIDVHKEVFAAAIAFANSHLFSSLNNRLLVLAGGINSTNKKFKHDPSKNDFIASLETFFRQSLTEHAGYVEAQSSQYSAAISLSICAFQKFKKQFPNSNGSILIINLAENLSSEQNSLMNLFFAARHCSLKVHVASLNGAVPILQQACDITDGIHMTLKSPELLSQSIMGNCTPNSSEINFDRPPEDIDYRAVCHCHNHLLNIGWVCSVCLSITCNFVPFCKICNAIFPRPISNQQKRTKKN